MTSSRKAIAEAGYRAGVYDFMFLGRLRDGCKRNVIDFCMNVGLIAMQYACPKCGASMKLVERNNVNDGFNWVCCVRDGACKHYVKRSVRKGSWFEESRLSMSEVLMLTYLWVKKTTNAWIMDEINVSDPTVIDWKSFCRKVYAEMLVNESCEIGGHGITVEIDQSKFGKRKYNRSKRVDGKWMFGGVERGSRKCFFVVVQNRTKELLIDVIKRFILPGSMVISDCWSLYNTIADEGYQHLTVNYSINFKDTKTGAQTNSIEGSWSAIKRDFRKT